MGAREGNINARKERTRVSVPLSIGGTRLQWAIKQLQTQGIEPTDQAISRFVKDYCYQKIDEAVHE